MQSLSFPSAPVSNAVARMNRFARSRNGAASIKSSTPLTLDAVRRAAPSVFASGAHGSRSDQYAHIPTSDVLAKLMKEGFHPYSVMQGGSRDEGKRDFTKHLIRLRHESQGAITVGGNFHEIVLLNSHDGTSSYRLMAGIFRLVCGNGLIVADTMLNDIRIPHKGDITGMVIDGCVTMLDQMPMVSDSVAQMQSTRLTLAEQSVYAEAALHVRYGDEKPALTPAQVLVTRRQEDAVPTVWNTFNTVQESLIRGGMRASTGRRTREVKGIDQNTHLNRALWTMAQRMQQMKTTGELVLAS